MEIKRFIDISVPVHICNLKCSYCYVSQFEAKNLWKKTYDIPFNYSPEQVKKALTQERLGGVCHFNVCGAGETLIPTNLIDYIRVILENGHSVMIVTNGTITERFEAFAQFPEELRKRLGFKFSFHYLELKKLNLMDKFFHNIDIARNNGMSFSLEITANDEYEPFIEDIKKICMDKVGALCHVSIPRNEPEKGIPLLSKHTIEEFYDIWKVFDSAMLDNKARYWGQKRKEFCYAGKYTALLSLGTGLMIGCYLQKFNPQNIFEDVTKPINWCPVGKCAVAHCFNAHAFLGFGDIPDLEFCSYREIRDRIDKDGKHWLTEEMREHMGCKLYNCNDRYEENHRIKYNIKRCKININTLAKKILKKISRNERKQKNK